MRYLHWQVGRAADIERFVDRFHHSVTFVTNMRGVNALIACSDFGQAHHFLRGAVNTRQVDQSGRQADRAVLHRHIHQALHVALFICGSVAVGKPHGLPPHRIVADQRGDVDRCL